MIVGCSTTFCLDEQKTAKTVASGELAVRSTNGPRITSESSIKGHQQHGAACDATDTNSGGCGEQCETNNLTCSTNCLANLLFRVPLLTHTPGLNSEI